MAWPIFILVPEHANRRLITHAAGLGAKSAGTTTLGGFLFGTKTGFLR